MTMRTSHARPRLVGRLILRRLFDAPHPRPQPHLALRAKPPGNEQNTPAN
ncbi:MAG TPA: hypothetical protein VNH11_21325 [Pirellulales bacterium]|nr:hypothetical protein [Pirellulales bacterium]